jgi:hypothetical protein
MKCVRQTAAHTWADYKTNTEIAKQLNIIPIFLKKYRNTTEIGCNIQQERPVIDYNYREY